MFIIRFIILLTGMVCSSLPALAADKYPTRPMKFVVGFLAGGPNDTIARIFCEYLQSHLGQPCVVENKAGQGGMIAAKSVIDSPSDGYTFMFVAPNNAIGQSLYKNLPFNHVRDTTPIAGIMQLANMMVVPPSLPVKTVAEFIAYGKANPGKLTFASSGNGTSVHMSGELFKFMTGLDIVHVPYRGSAGIYPDLLTGKVDSLFDNLPGVVEFVKTGKLRALGVTTAKRNAALPDVPTVGETVPGYEASALTGIGAPRSTPAEIVERLNREINAGLQDAALLKRFADVGGVPIRATPTEMAELIAKDTDKWAKVVKAAGLQPE